MLPGWHAEAVEDVNFLAPFKFYRSEPRALTTEATFYPEGDSVIAECRLIGRRSLPNQKDPQITTHFTARVRLTRKPSHTETVVAPGKSEGKIIEAADIYRIYFHGPAYRVIELAWRDGKRMIGRMAKGLPNNHQPSEWPAVIAPRLIELCFQTAGLLEMTGEGRFGLPRHIDRVCVWRAPSLADAQLYAVVTPSAEGSFDAEVVDARGTRYAQLSGYSTVALAKIEGEALKAMQAVA
jgi:hypothetical protein